VLEAVFILLESPSPSRRIFIGSHSLPPSLVRHIGPSELRPVSEPLCEEMRRLNLEVVPQGSFYALTAESDLYDRIVTAQRNDEDIQTINRN
jgi:hypothetical protein